MQTLLTRLFSRPTAWVGIATLVLCLRHRFTYSIEVGWQDEFLEFAGVVIAVTGALLFFAVRTLHTTRLNRNPLYNPGAWAVTGGAALAVGHPRAGLTLLAVCGSSLILLLLRHCGTDPHRLRQSLTSWWRSSGCQLVIREATALCSVCALLLCVEIWEDASGPGGPKTHLAELSFWGLFLAALGVVWAAREDGCAAVYPTRAALAPPAPSALFGRALCLFSAFVGLTCAVRIPNVQAFDESVASHMHLVGGPALTRLMTGISNAGGGWFVCWVLTAALILVVLGRARSLRFFASTLMGAMCLSGAFKTLVHRMRPPFASAVHPPLSNSYPSGHVLAAATLAAVLVVIWSSPTRRGPQQSLLRLAAAGWVALMSLSRVYLGQHYATDVLGGVLLGTAWVSLCHALLLALAYAVENPGRSADHCADSAVPSESPSPNL